MHKIQHEKLCKPISGTHNLVLICFRILCRFRIQSDWKNERVLLYIYEPEKKISMTVPVEKEQLFADHATRRKGYRVLTKIRVTFFYLKKSVISLDTKLRSYIAWYNKKF